MTWVQRVTGAVHGTGLVYKFDGRAWTFFDFSARGFWNAYIVAIILAPLQIWHRLLIYDAEKDAAFLPYFIVEVLSYIVTWTLFPFAMLYLGCLLGRMQRYFFYMVPYLWMQLPMGLLLFGAQILVDLGVLPAEAMDPLNLCIIAAYAIFGTFVASIGLQIATGTALALVALDYVLGLLAFQVISQI